MYRLGHQIKHHYLLYILAGCFLIAGCTVGGVFLIRSLKSNVVLKQSKPIFEHVSTASTVRRVIKQSFSVELPTNWQSVPPPPTLPMAYSWSGLAPDGTGRRLDIYVDQIPATLAVNRLLPVQAAGGKMQTTGSVSDNCINFTDKATESMQTGTAPAKWDSVSFICDMANYERNVVATGSSSGANSVTLTGTTGTHQFLLVYADNSINPNFSTFSSIVQSFQTL